jgi:hypothetical protein
MQARRQGAAPSPATPLEEGQLIHFLKAINESDSQYHIGYMFA